jgi:hypothetical protein
MSGAVTDDTGERSIPSEYIQNATMLNDGTASAATATHGSSDASTPRTAIAEPE